MYVCVCVCVLCVCACVCVHACVAHVCAYVCVCACVFVRMHARTYKSPSSFYVCTLGTTVIDYVVCGEDIRDKYLLLYNTVHPLFPHRMRQVPRPHLMLIKFQHAVPTPNSISCLDIVVRILLIPPSGKKYRCSFLDRLVNQRTRPSRHLHRSHRHSNYNPTSACHRPTPLQ